MKSTKKTKQNKNTIKKANAVIAKNPVLKKKPDGLFNVVDKMINPEHKKEAKTTSGKIKTDWEALKREFFVDPDFFNITTWLREKKGWDSKKISNGNTIAHIDGWGKEKANLQQKITDDEIEAIRREERKRYPKLLKNKMNLIVELTKRIEGRQMEVGRGKNKKVLVIPESIKGLEAIWKIIKIEMGEPIIIQKNENENKDAQEVEELRAKLDEAIKNANEVE